MPGNPGGFLLSIVLGALALFSVGLLVAALAPTGRAASGIGTALFFPMLALGGVWVPKEQLPAVLQHVADVLPLGATLNALRATWAGDAPEAAAARRAWRPSPSSAPRSRRGCSDGSDDRARHRPRVRPVAPVARARWRS